MGRSSHQPSDRELLLASRGESRGFDLFYRRHRDAVLAFHGGRTAEPELAADLTAETFATVLLVVRDPLLPKPSQRAEVMTHTPHYVLIEGAGVDGHRMTPHHGGRSKTCMGSADDADAA